jgi:uncharacterized membrane protein
MTNAVKEAAGSGLGKKAADVMTAELRNLMAALQERLVTAVTERIEGLTDRLTNGAVPGGDPGEVADPGEEAAAAGARKLARGESPVRAALSAGVTGAKAKIKQVVGKGKGGDTGGKKKTLKVTNIVETIDVGVRVRVAYDQWTQFADFPSFMKKVENVDQESDEKTNWKAQIFWSHRTWEATIVEQVPDQHIIWRSKAPKGSVDGTVSFHELAPDLTRIVLVMEYHPQGLFERTGNIWRAQGRRTRLELKHFVRHVMTRTILEQDRLEGWRGEIRDSHVVRNHEEAVEQERRLEKEQQGQLTEDAEQDRWAGEPDRESDESDEGPSPERRPGPKRGGAARPARGADVEGSRR